MTIPQSHRALRILLFVMSALTGVAGFVLVFATGFMLSMSPSVVALGNGGILNALVKALGIIAIAFGYLLCVAARDPVRYVVIIDTVIFTLVGAGLLNLYAVAVLDLGTFYPTPYLIVRALIQLAIALALFLLRPKERASAGTS